MKITKKITKKVMQIAAAGLFIALSSLFCSCMTARVEPEADCSVLEIVQMAQDSYDKGNTADALYYYDVLLSRYGTDASVYVEGRYEIAHIHFKAKDYEKAAPIYEEIIAIFNSVMPGTLPEAYRKLSINDYSKIPQKFKSAEN